MAIKKDYLIDSPFRQSNLLIAPCDTFITYTTMFGPEGFASHALNTEGLSIESSFRRKIFNNLGFILIT